VDRCKRLVEKLKLSDRVKFTAWFEDHNDLLRALDGCRGLILPTIEDANGIAVQEAMAMGLPPICLDWGGPQLLIDDGNTGFLVEPTSYDHITTELAKCMDLLAADGDFADKMAGRARQAAMAWRWSTVASTWLAKIASATGLRSWTPQPERPVTARS
jgi:glycosyltransferase involved in cell wall biosynthesis